MHTDCKDRELQPNHDTDISWLDRFKAWPQYPLPHYALSNIMYRLTRSRIYWWKNWFINWFIRQYNVDMKQALNPDPKSYNCFNDFFTRPLNSSARPITQSPSAISCPVDGQVSQLGNINKHRIFQAKNQEFDLLELLGGDVEEAKHFNDGQFATIYLSPKDYHRIHMPESGELTKMTHIPGRLFSVSPATTRAVPRLFARNERVINYFTTQHGQMAVILVGAIFVASMETVWQGTISPPHGRYIRHWYYGKNKEKQEPSQGTVKLAKGEEMARFNMGSTVILLFPKNQLTWSDSINPGTTVQMGQSIANYPT